MAGQGLGAFLSAIAHQPFLGVAAELLDRGLSFQGDRFGPPGLSVGEPSEHRRM